MRYILNLTEVHQFPSFVLPAHSKTIDRILIDESKGMRKVAVWYGEMELGGVAEAHLHQDMEQVFFILEGEGVFEIGGEEYKVGKESLVFIPCGIRHKISAINGLKILIFMSPPPRGSEEWIRG